MKISLHRKNTMKQRERETWKYKKLHHFNHLEKHIEHTAQDGIFKHIIFNSHMLKGFEAKYFVYILSHKLNHLEK